MQLVKRSDGQYYAPSTESEVKRFMSLKEPCRTRVIMCCILLREWGYDPYVIEGYRTLAEQKKKVKSGFSKTLNSKHVEGLAADIVSYSAYQQGDPWNLTPIPMRRAIGRAARITALYWGGQWESFGPYGDWAHVEWKEGKI